METTNIIDITPQLKAKRDAELRPFDIAYAEVAGISLEQLLKESDELRDLIRTRLEGATRPSDI